MASLRIKEILIRNFRSFGDYDTILRLDGLGPVLILGQINSDDTHSNGAGKSSATDAIIWALFGRLSAKDKPGDHVINKITNKPCLVRITTTDGATITRTRAVDGNEDLLIHSPDGTDISDSTTKNAQNHLKKLYNLDYEIFMNSIFFSQAGRPFLELPDQKRKKALERLLGMTRYDYYVTVAKEKVAKVETNQMRHRGELEQIERDILRATKQLEENYQLVDKHELERGIRLEKVKLDLDELNKTLEAKANLLREQLKKDRAELETISLVDKNQLIIAWSEYNEYVKTIDEIIARRDKLKLEVQSLEIESSNINTTGSTTELESKITQLQDKQGQIKAVIKQIKTYDITDLETKWDEYRLKQTEIDEIKQKIENHNNNIVKLNTAKEIILDEIGDWKTKAGTTCPQCKQKISKEHTHTITHPAEGKLADIEKLTANELTKISHLGSTITDIQNTEIHPGITIVEAEAINKHAEAKTQELVTITDSIKQLQQQKTKMITESKDAIKKAAKISEAIEIKKKVIGDLNKQIAGNLITAESMKPKLTIHEADLHKINYDTKEKALKSTEQQINDIIERKEKEREKSKQTAQSIKAEQNPYKIIGETLSTELGNLKTLRQSAEHQVGLSNILIRHIDYIRSAYADRKKIRAFVLSRLIPFFNQRIKYYLDTLECDFPIEFNVFLQTKSDKWPYELWSGGERKRIDMAIQFAIYDLHQSIYGLQSNVLVLDEVDGRLDADGVNVFANLIFKDFAETNKIDRPNTVLVISHKNELRDIFPTKIMVSKRDDLSYIEEVR